MNENGEAQAIYDEIPPTFTDKSKKLSRWAICTWSTYSASDLCPFVEVDDAFRKEQFLSNSSSEYEPVYAKLL